MQILLGNRQIKTTRKIPGLQYVQYWNKLLTSDEPKDEQQQQNDDATMAMTNSTKPNSAMIDDNTAAPLLYSARYINT